MYLRSLYDRIDSVIAYLRHLLSSNHILPSYLRGSKSYHVNYRMGEATETNDAGPPSKNSHGDHGIDLETNLKGIFLALVSRNLSSTPCISLKVLSKKV